MCVYKNHAFIYFLRPPSWSGTFNTCWRSSLESESVLRTTPDEHWDASIVNTLGRSPSGGRYIKIRKNPKILYVEERIFTWKILEDLPNSCRWCMFSISEILLLKRASTLSLVWASRFSIFSILLKLRSSHSRFTRFSGTIRQTLGIHIVYSGTSVNKSFCEQKSVHNSVYELCSFLDISVRFVNFPLLKILYLWKIWCMNISFHEHFKLWTVRAKHMNRYNLRF